MSMAHSLEARVPFFDVDYISTAMAGNPAKKLILPRKSRKVFGLEADSNSSRRKQPQFKIFQNPQSSLQNQTNVIQGLANQVTSLTLLWISQLLWDHW